MTAKMAKKILRKYEVKMLRHQAGIVEAPEWLKRLWKKATRAALA